jgi:hypothetical protein
MSSKWPIRELAAYALCPNSRADGIQQLDMIIRVVAKRVQALDALFKALRILSWSVFSLSCLATILIILAGSSSRVSLTHGWIALGISAVACASVRVAWLSLQHGVLSRWFGQVDDTLIPDVLRVMIRDFERAERNAWTRNQSVDAGLFKSGWAILLFSDDGEVRNWVRSARGGRDGLEIFTAKTELQHLTPIALNQAPSIAFNIAVDQSQHLIAVDQSLTSIAVDQRQTNITIVGGEHCEEAPLANNVEENQWLVGGLQRRFRTGLRKYLATVLPHRRDWEEMVLVVGRRELRKGGQDGAQAAAIRAIIESLKSANLAYPDTERGDSTSTIKQRLQGKRGKSDIKGYFLVSSARNSAEKLRRTG